jgi:hypothetical protein
MLSQTQENSSSTLVATGLRACALPSWVSSVSVVNSTVGFLGAIGNWVNASSDARALADPADPSRRALGATQPVGGPTSPVDIVLTDAAKAAGKRWVLSLYFVDFGRDCAPRARHACATRAPRARRALSPALRGPCSLARRRDRL